MCSHKLSSRAGVALTLIAALATNNAWAQSPTDTPTPAVAPAKPTYAIEGGALVKKTKDSESARLELPCAAPSKVIASGGAFYVACKNSLLVIEDGANGLEVSEQITTPGAPKDVVRIDGELWVGFEVVEVRAEPLSKLRARAQTAPATKPATPPDEREKPKPDATPKPEEVVVQPIGKVLSSKAGEVVIDLGIKDGVEVGDRLEFYIIEEVIIDADTTTQQERVVTVAEVSASSEERSKAQLGLNIAVEPGAYAREVSRGGPSWALPPRASGLAEFSAVVRPFLALGELGGGAMTDLQAVYRFEAPMSASLRMTPLVFGANTSGNAGTVALSGLFAYDTDLLQIGLGIGTSRITSGNPSDLGSFVLTLSQTARLGARDGFNIEVFNQFSLYNQEFGFESLHIHAQIPISQLLDNTWIIARGGGGVLLTHGFGEVGLRRLIRGNGLHDSLFLSLTVGGGGFLTERVADCQFDYEVAPCTENSGYGGPMVGFGLEWRP